MSRTRPRMASPKIASAQQIARKLVRDETPISRRKVRTQPQVTEQNVSGVLHDARSDVAELLLPSPSTPRLVCGSGISVSEIKVSVDSPQPADGVVEATIIR
jgi:hypothetical protein